MVIAADPSPTAEQLARIAAELGVADDPVYLTKDHSEARQRADLLAHIAAGIVAQLTRAEAGMAVDECADLHWDADRAVAAGRSPLDLQITRLAWVHHAITRTRGPRQHPVADTVTTTLGTLVQLLENWTDQPDPMLTDALLMLRGAADHVARVLRTRPTFSQLPGEASARSGPTGTP
jgi:hypothetical protein